MKKYRNIWAKICKAMAVIILLFGAGGGLAAGYAVADRVFNGDMVMVIGIAAAGLLIAIIANAFLFMLIRAAEDTSALRNELAQLKNELSARADTGNSVQ